MKIPEIYDDLSSRNVLTMEFVEGVSVEDTQGVKMFSDMAGEFYVLKSSTNVCILFSVG